MDCADVPTRVSGRVQIKAGWVKYKNIYFGKARIASRTADDSSLNSLLIFPHEVCIRGITILKPEQKISCT